MIIFKLHICMKHIQAQISIVLCLVLLTLNILSSVSMKLRSLRTENSHFPKWPKEQFLCWEILDLLPSAHTALAPGDFVRARRSSPLFISVCSLGSSVMSNSLWPPWTVACQAPLSMEFSRQKILEWVAISFSRGSSQPRDQTCISRVSWNDRKILYHCATWEVPIYF